MLEHLFGSKTRVKLLRLCFRHPDKTFFVRELTRLLDIQINAIRRELTTLLKTGIILETGGEGENEKDEGKPGVSLRRYYRLNKESVLYQELDALLLKGQIAGEQKFVQDLQEKIGEIMLLLLTGQFTHDKRAPSDLLVVGTIKQGTLDRLIQLHEKELGFEIRYTVMTEKEFQDRRYVMDKFLYSLFEAEHIKVVNTLQIR